MIGGIFLKDSQVAARIAEALVRIRERKPLIHHITNYVVMNDTANVTLHVGALPVMAHAQEEVEEMVALAGALVLNPGTLDAERVEAMVRAGRRANELGIPVVLDPVGAGATVYRTAVNQRLLKAVSIRIVRGNSGEVGALIGAGGIVRGVESVAGVDDPVAVGHRAAREWSAVVAITGARDVICDGERALGVDNGHRWLTTLTGTGCMATTMVAAFAAVEVDPLIAATGGLACFGLAAQLAAERAAGPASFKVALFDTLYNLTPGQLEAGAQVIEL